MFCFTIYRFILSFTTTRTIIVVIIVVIPEAFIIHVIKSTRGISIRRDLFTSKYSNQKIFTIERG